MSRTKLEKILLSELMKTEGFNLDNYKFAKKTLQTMSNMGEILIQSIKEPVLLGENESAVKESKIFLITKLYMYNEKLCTESSWKLMF